jgi:hypothetical protein
MNEVPEAPVPETKTLKTRKKREMTPELLEKLKLARERAAELRQQAKETKSKLPAELPEKERSKVAQYLATRKAIKAKIKEEIVEEIEKTPSTKSLPSTSFGRETNTEHEVDSKGYMLPTPKESPPPVPKSDPVPIPQRVKKIKEAEIESDEEEEYTTIKVPKKKLIKWKQYAERPPPEPEKSKRNVPQYNPYTTQHLINLAMNGYKF